MDWASLGWDSVQYANWLAGLPQDLQKQLAQCLPYGIAHKLQPGPRKEDEPWDMSSGEVTELLGELGLLPLYGQTFAEYGLRYIYQLTSNGPEAMEVMLRELGVTRDHRDRLVLLALSPRPCGSNGRAFSRDFLAACRPAHAATMGAENLGPLLYSIVRFIKPCHVVEVGAGYTSLWLLQALSDNVDELARCAAAVERDGYLVGSPPNQAEWLLPTHQKQQRSSCGESDADAIDQSPGAYGGWAGMGHPTLHTIDSLSHEHTTAHAVCKIAGDLGLTPFLDLIKADAYALPSDKGFGVDTSSEFVDALWLDFGVGAGARLGPFLETWWPRIRPGGFLLVHSTLTNAVTRKWLDGVRTQRHGEAAMAGEETNLSDPNTQAAAVQAIKGVIETISFREPHKKWQNSISIFQKRSSGWAEPLLTTFP